MPQLPSSSVGRLVSHRSSSLSNIAHRERVHSFALWSAHRKNLGQCLKGCVAGRWREHRKRRGGGAGQGAVDCCSTVSLSVCFLFHSYRMRKTAKGGRPVTRHNCAHRLLRLQCPRYTRSTHRHYVDQFKNIAPRLVRRQSR